MYLALYTLLIILLIVNTIADYNKIKSNKEVIKRINENNKNQRIIINFGNEETKEVSVNKINDLKIN